MIKHIFIDMDATICNFATPDGKVVIKSFNQPGLFIDRKPLKIMIKAIQNIFPEEDFVYYILSASPNAMAIEEKQAWLDINFNIRKDRRYFVKFPEDCKGEFIKDFCQEKDVDPKECVLIDDTYSHLKPVEEMGGLAIHPTHLLAKYEELLDAELENCNVKIKK